MLCWKPQNWNFIGPQFSALLSKLGRVSGKVIKLTLRTTQWQGICIISSTKKYRPVLKFTNVGYVTFSGDFCNEAGKKISKNNFVDEFWSNGRTLGKITQIQQFFYLELTFLIKLTSLDFRVLLANFSKPKSTQDQLLQILLSKIDKLDQIFGSPKYKVLQMSLTGLAEV